MTTSTKSPLERGGAQRRGVLPRNPNDPASFLLSHFDRLAEAPGGIAKLRALIRQLAVEGKLVEQSSSDKPVRLVAPLIEDNQPFDVPESWCWISLSGAAKFNMGKTPSTKNSSFWDVGGIPWVSIRDIEQYGSIAQTAKRVSTKAASEVFRCPPVPAGTLVMSFKLSIGKVGFLTVPAYHNEAIISIYPIPGVSKEYLFHFLPVLAPLAASKGAIKGSTLNRESLSALPIPVPPLAEQRRIVAKVEELMGLCDALEAAQQERENVRTRLRTSALHQLASPDSDSKCASFILEYLPVFTKAREDLADIRKSVLQLAVRGQLVAQDPKDETASGLLKRIQAEKARLVKEGTLREQKVLPPIEEAEMEFDLPNGWQWVRMGEVIKLWNGYAFKSGDFQREGIPVIRIGDLQGGEVVLSDAVYVSEAVASDVVQEAWIPPGALLIAMSGATTGKVAFNRTNSRLLLNQRVGRIEVFSMSVDFLKFFFETIIARNLSISFGTAIPNLSSQQINETVIPLPPLAEQRRIVAKVDELMAVLDALEATLTTVHTTAERLLAATIARLHGAEDARQPVLSAAEEPGPYGEAVKVTGFSTSMAFTRATLAAEIVHRMHGDRTFGQIKFQKALYLAEYVAQLTQIDSHPERYQNGPHDPELIAQVETKMKECEWFEAVSRPGGHGNEYRPLAQAGGHQEHFEKLWPVKAAGIRKLIEEMKTWKTERCERFATLYAAWNDLIIWNKPTDDNAILDQVLKHWHTAKQQIPKSSWQEMLTWMKREGYVPTGWGRATKTTPEAELFPSQSI